MILPKKSEEVVRLLPERHVLPIRVYEKIQKNDNKMAYEVIVLGHLHMPLYFLGTFTEYPYFYLSPNGPTLSQLTLERSLIPCRTDS